jgi:hypothetical protein
LASKEALMHHKLAFYYFLLLYVCDLNIGAERARGGGKYTLAFF